MARSPVKSLKLSCQIFTLLSVFLVPSAYLLDKFEYSVWFVAFIIMLAVYFGIMAVINAAYVPHLIAKKDRAAM